MRVLLLILLASFHLGVSAQESYEEARQAVAEGELERALDAFEDALRKEPNNLKYGNDYRLAAVRAEAYDRSLSFFAELVEENPQASHAFLNYGFAYVDKIPVAGSITRVIHANNALTYFGKALEVEPSWLAYYTRGNSYLFWPKIFNRTQLGIADLERALAFQKESGEEAHHLRTYLALGDGYWKMGESTKAVEVWEQGLAVFPDSEALQKRIEASPEERDGLIAEIYDPNRRVNTDLSELWEDQ